MYENNLQYHSIENFRGFKKFKKKFKIKKPKPISIKPISNQIKKSIIKPISSGTVDLGNTIGSKTVDLGNTVGLGNTIGSGTVDFENTDDSGTVDFEDDYNEINDDDLLLDNDDETISTTFIIIIVVIILLILPGLYFLI